MKKFLEIRGQWIGMVTGIAVGLTVGVGTNLVNMWISEPTWISRLERSLSLSTEEVMSLHPRWRQIVADIIVAPDKHTKEVVQLVGRMTARDLQLLEYLAGYAVNDWIVRDDSRQTRHSVPNITVGDFENMEHIGLLRNVEHGIRVVVGRTVTNQRISGLPNWQERRLRVGDLMVFAMTEDANKELTFDVSKLTPEAKHLLNLRNARVGSRHLEFLCNQIKGQGFHAWVGSVTDAWVPITRAGHLKGGVFPC